MIRIRSPLFAAFTAAWMSSYLQRLSSLISWARRFLAFLPLPTQLFLIRFFALGLQTTRAGAVVGVFVLVPLAGSGKKVARSACAPAPAGSARASRRPAATSR